MMNILSFRRSSWYLSGVFTLFVVILILIFVIILVEISSFIITLSSSITKLLIPYNNNYNDLLVALNIKPNAYNLDNYNINTYNLPV